MGKQVNIALEGEEYKRASEMAREISKDMSQDFYKVTQAFYDHQARLKQEQTQTVALAAPLFAVEQHVSSMLVVLLRENAHIAAERIAKMVEEKMRAEGLWNQ